MSTDEARPLTDERDDRPPGVARVETSLTHRAGREAICRALADPSWLGRAVESPPDRPGHRRVETDLAFVLPSDARTLTFRKAAYVDIGPVRQDPDGCVAEIGWRASSLAPLFPVFAGMLEVRDSVLRLEGVYAPPGGGVGLLVDRTLLQFVAKRTAVWFLERLAVDAAAAPPPAPRGR
jgi:hypothetical protein